VNCSFESVNLFLEDFIVSYRIDFAFFLSIGLVTTSGEIAQAEFLADLQLVDYM
jgi:hypothetical protein